MSNPNPDEQLRDLNLLNLCNCDGFWHVEGEDGVSRYLDDIVEALIKEREELARKETKSIMKMADMYTFEDGTVFVKLKGGKK